MALITRLLSAKPPCSCSAVASELHRRVDFQTDLASVRRWAIESKLAPVTRHKTPPKPVKCWQARDHGVLFYLRHASDAKAKPIVLLHVPGF
jgi:hypothetical protein